MAEYYDDDESSTPMNDWLDEFSKNAENALSEGSGCAQIHPVVEAWFERLMEGGLPEQRPSVEQALACLSTEILSITPLSIRQTLFKHCDDDELASWLQNLLAIGQAFQIGLDRGQLDDL